MTLYLAESQIPELATLSRRQRRFVRQGAFAMLRSEQPSAASICGVLAGSFAAGLAVAGNGLSHVAGLEHKLIVMVAFGLAGAIVGAFIGAQLLTHRLRPYFRRFIQEHIDEIRAVSAPDRPRF